MSETAHISIRILSQPQYLSVVRTAVEAAACKMGLPEEACNQVALAVDEAVANVIRHGYKGRTDRPIWLKITPVHNGDVPGMEIVVEDECSGVDLTKIKSRSLEEVRPGGLGVHIITGVMDHVEYNSRPDGTGVRLKMVKYAKPSKPAKPVAPVAKS